MKHVFSLIATMTVGAVFLLSQTGCTGVYAVGPAYGPYATYGGAYYGGAGFYHGAYYGSSAYWNNGSGRAYGARGGYASWNDGSGSARGWRGSTASWNHGSESISGYRGGSASWGGGSGSATGGGARPPGAAARAHSMGLSVARAHGDGDDVTAKQLQASTSPSSRRGVSSGRPF